MERGRPHSDLWDLARAILLLYGKLEEVKGQTTNSLLAILEELIGIVLQWFSNAFTCYGPPPVIRSVTDGRPGCLSVIPQPWHVENVARLMVLCGSSLCYTVLASKAINGRLLEISRLIVYIILVRILSYFIIG